MLSQQCSFTLIPEILTYFRSLSRDKALIGPREICPRVNPGLRLRCNDRRWDYSNGPGGGRWHSNCSPYQETAGVFFRLRASDLASRHPALYCRCFDAVAVAGHGGTPSGTDWRPAWHRPEGLAVWLSSKFHTPPPFLRIPNPGHNSGVWAFGWPGLPGAID